MKDKQRNAMWFHFGRTQAMKTQGIRLVRSAAACGLLISTVAACTQVISPSNPTLTSSIASTSAPTTAVSIRPTPTLVAPPPAGMNQDTRDTSLAFNVFAARKEQDVSAGESPAQGVYIDVAIFIRNVGKEPQEFTTAYQKLLDGDGREYSPALDAMISAWANLGFSGRESINPGNEIASDVFFDVPKGTRVSDYTLLLRDTKDSLGTKVALQCFPQEPSCS